MLCCRQRLSFSCKFQVVYWKLHLSNQTGYYLTLINSRALTYAPRRNAFMIDPWAIHLVHIYRNEKQACFTWSTLLENSPVRCWYSLNGCSQVLFLKSVNSNSVSLARSQSIHCYSLLPQEAWQETPTNLMTTITWKKTPLWISCQ